MAKDFNFNGNIKDIQNRLVAQSIREVSNIQLLRSDEAIQNVIKSYTDRFRAVEGRLTDMANYVAKSKEIITTSYFNELFESIHIDLSALYKDMSLVDEVLNLNLYRNKNFFSVIKRRLKDLWYRLNLARKNKYDESPGDESYYESFNTQLNIKDVRNLIVDRKNGFIYLDPVYDDVHNEDFVIKKISSVTYPVENEDGGVLHTGSVLNTFEENYKNGPRDMLQNGLFKQEVICADIPDMTVNIGSDDSPIYRNYKGVVSLVDIEFAYQVDINRFDFDVFGDYVTKIDMVLYKNKVDGEWKPVLKELDDSLETRDSIGSNINDVASAEVFDIGTLFNTTKITAKCLRIIFNQENYEFVDSLDSSNESVDQKIFEDLSERRYEIIRFGSNIDDILSTPVNDDNVSLYSKIINIIESTQSIEKILMKIGKLLSPPISIKSYDFSKLMKFELGAWSIEPSLQRYNPLIGTFTTSNYDIKDRALISVSLNTQQSTPRASTCNWYIKLGKKDVPVVENDKIWRKEPINIVRPSFISNYSDWPGVFILLDFPVDPVLANYIELFIDGTRIDDQLSRLIFLNSRLVYLHYLRTNNVNMVVRYPAAVFKSVNVYTLSSSKPDINIVSIIASRKEALQFCVDNYEPFKGKYSVASCYATIDEAAQWFGLDFSKSIFIDRTKEFNWPEFTNSKFILQSYKAGASKLQATITDVNDYLAGGGIFDFGPAGGAGSPNLAPMNMYREI